MSSRYISLGNIQALSGRKSDFEAAVPSSKGPSVRYSRPVPLLPAQAVSAFALGRPSDNTWLTPGPAPKGGPRAETRPEPCVAGCLAQLRLRRRRGVGVGLRNGGLRFLQPAVGRRHP